MSHPSKSQPHGRCNPRQRMPPRKRAARAWITAISNSDLDIDIELHDTPQRIRFEYQSGRTVIVTRARTHLLLAPVAPPAAALPRVAAANPPQNLRNSALATIGRIHSRVTSNDTA